VDQAALIHDLGYGQANTSLEREQLDLELIDRMDDLLEEKDIPIRERVEALMVKIAISLKCSIRYW
jgi:hypothetical protein